MTANCISHEEKNSMTSEEDARYFQRGENKNGSALRRHQFIADIYRDPMNERYLPDRLLTYKDLQDILHIGKNRAYELLKSECFPTIRINNRMYVSSRHLQEWLDKYAYGTFLV